MTSEKERFAQENEFCLPQKMVFASHSSPWKYKSAASPETESKKTNPSI